VTWRPAERDDRHVAALWALCAGMAAAKLMPGCAWHDITGWPCPGCGTTRALLHLMDAEPLRALALNPLATLAAVGFVAGGLAAPVWLACGGMRPFIPAGERRSWGVAVAVGFVLNWSWLAVSGV
jgi:hypothetical protein